MKSRNERRGLRALPGRRDGAAAVEFALVVVPFVWLLFGLLEFGALSLAQTNLDHALAETGRKIRTGEAQDAGLTRQDLEAEICASLNRMMAMACPDNLLLDVDRYESFAGAGGEAPTDGGALDLGQIGYAPGGGDDVILVRAYYSWTILTPVFDALLADLQGGKRLVVSAALFRNEPF